MLEKELRLDSWKVLRPRIINSKRREKSPRKKSFQKPKIKLNQKYLITKFINEEKLFVAIGTREKSQATKCFKQISRKTNNPRSRK